MRGYQSGACGDRALGRSQYHPRSYSGAESIRSATRNALVRADALGCRSVVLPVLGTGVAGFAFEEGARLVCTEVWRYEPTVLEDVGVVAYSEAAFQTLSRVAEAVSGD